MSDGSVPDYPKLRSAIGSENSLTIRALNGEFRPLIRLAFDTQILQLVANERSKLIEQEDVDPDWGIRGFHFETIEAKVVASQPSEMAFIYAICELARRHDVEIVKLPMVKAEIAAHPMRHGYFHGLERLDFDVRYTEYPITCEKLNLYSSSLVGHASSKDNCSRNIGKYWRLLQHLSGKGQVADAQAFIQADLAFIDVFITLDRKFIEPFRQIEPKLRLADVRTRVLRPSEFCDAAKIKPIPFGPPNPRQGMGSPSPER